MAREVAYCEETVRASIVWLPLRQPSDMRRRDMVEFANYSVARQYRDWYNERVHARELWEATRKKHPKLDRW